MVLDSGLRVLSLKDHIGIMAKKMETTIVYWGLYWENGKANGTYYLGFRVGFGV